MKKAFDLPRQGRRFALWSTALFIFSLTLLQCNTSSGDKKETSGPQTPDTTAIEPKIATADTTAAPATEIQAAEAEQSAPAPAADKKPAAPVAAAPGKKQAPKAPVPEAKSKAEPPAPEVAITDAPKPEAPAPEAVAKAEPKPKAPEATPRTEPKPQAPEAAPVVEVANFSVKSAKGTIEGSSTLHPWESQITKIACKGAFQTVNGAIETVRDVEVKIAVEGIKSKEGKVMDNKTYDTFQSDKNPYITYTFSSEKVKTDANKAVIINASGNLSMAGKTKPVKVTASGKLLPSGDMQLSVSQSLKMTDFGMKPPNMMLGTIKVGDEVTVKFDLVLTPGKAVK